MGEKGRMLVINFEEGIGETWSGDDGLKAREWLWHYNGWALFLVLVVGQLLII